MATEDPKVTIIGAGTLGSTIACALKAKDFQIASVISRTDKSAQSLARKLNCPIASTDLTKIDAESVIIVVAVPDNALRTVATELGNLKHLQFKNLFIAHTSGVHSASILIDPEKKGALVAAVHPIQTFPKSRPQDELIRSLRLVYFGVDGSVKAMVKAKRLVKLLGGKAIEISAELRPLYHAACVFSSSYLITILNAIEEISKRLELPDRWQEVFGPLMQSASMNMQRDGAAKALTGPIIRGDVETLRQHMQSLEKNFPELLSLYAACGLTVANIAANNGQLSEKEHRAIVQLLSNVKIVA